MDPELKPTISASSDDCMDTDAMKELNFLLSGSKNMRIEETPVFNIRLIAEVKSRPFLYDQADEGYNMIAWRNSAWNEISEALETTPEHVKTRWKTLRDRYKKEEKKERVSKKPSSWVFQRPLRFIQAHLKDRHTDESEPLEAKLEGDVSPMEATINFIENEIIRNQENTSTSSSVEDSASTASSSSLKLETTSETTNRSNGRRLSTPPHLPIPIPMNVTPSPSTTSSNVAPPTKRARHTEPAIPIQARNAAAAAAAAASLGIFPWTQNRDDEEDEIFGRMIALKLSKLDARTKELAKMQVLKAIFDAQYGST
ncbi:unnamed protein product [Caenorhabditis angaria]|uniref:MADF domain-containing protein n=1 Tax=Caenorhabditis angaria TaxID=860376 RepID=A0A9P1IQ12_9PELO|nr:unnamed protein product [Caenorhabditis angaria]